MEPTTTTVKLGGKEYIVKIPFLLGNLRRFTPAYERYDMTLKNAENYDALIEAIVYGLNADYPEVTVKSINEMRTTPRELQDAGLELAISCGLYKRQAPGEVKEAQGEQKAGNETLIGEKSTPS